MRILVVEDDLEAQRYLVQGLKESGHVVDEASDGETGLAQALSRPYDVAIVDRMLPKLDGLKVVAEMREHGNNTPVLFLSALSEVDDRVKGLKAGGDDYLTKPYAFVELLARIDALLRRRSRVFYGGMLKQWPSAQHPITDKPGVISYGAYQTEAEGEAFSLDELVYLHERLASCMPYARDLLVLVPDGAIASDTEVVRRSSRTVIQTSQWTMSSDRSIS